MISKNRREADFGRNLSIKWKIKKQGTEKLQKDCLLATIKFYVVIIMTIVRE